jgi:hypothetical protein
MEDGERKDKEKMKNSYIQLVDPQIYVKEIHHLVVKISTMRYK